MLVLLQTIQKYSNNGFPPNQNGKRYEALKAVRNLNTLESSNELDDSRDSQIQNNQIKATRANQLDSSSNLKHLKNMSNEDKRNCPIIDMEYPDKTYFENTNELNSDTNIVTEKDCNIVADTSSKVNNINSVCHMNGISLAECNSETGNELKELVLSEVSNKNDTTMSRKWGGVATSTSTNRVRKPASTPKPPVEEELWPEEKSSKTSPGAKPALDEFEKMEQEVMEEMEKEKESKRKKGETEKKKKKKKRKGDNEKENKISTSQSKDELYEKHVGPRIRSFDPAKMKSKFSKPKEPTQVSTECRICGKQVFQMEKIVAEKASWHKNCFRCKECNKNLTLETYQSHEGALYCKPHFKELFKPKAVIQNEEQERKDRQMRRPRMIVLESQPEALPEDVVRATAKPDYGLEELNQNLNVKERFNIFENLNKESDQPRVEPIAVKRSQSMMSKAAARFFDGDQAAFDSDEDEEKESEEEEEVDEEEEEEDRIVKGNRKKKERPMSFSGMGDLKAAWEQKQRREELTQSRKDEIARFRQMLCAGKNITLKERFERGELYERDSEEEDGVGGKKKEEIKIEGKRAASNLKKIFEQGQPFILEDAEDEEGEGEENGVEDDEDAEERPVRRPKKVKSKIVSEKQEVEEIFKEAETAKKARNVFKHIDSKVAQEEVNPLLRSQSFANSNRENRRSLDVSLMMHKESQPGAEVVKSSEKSEDFVVDTSDLSNRFKFFMNYEKDKESEREANRKVFRITPPREGLDHQSMQGADDLLGRDPNLIKCTDNYQDEVDCRNTKNLLQMFRKLEMGNEDDDEDDEGPRPLKRFTPPPGSEEYEEESDEEYSDEEYSDEDEEEEEEEDEGVKRERVRDEILQMLAQCSSQSARKAAQLRAKFEKWEANNQNGTEKKEDLEEIMPSLDTAKNLKAMFEQKVIEVVKPVASKPITQKVNRFV